MSVFDYHRRPTSTVRVGDTPLGSDYPVRIQSMTSTSTMDTDASVAQCERIIAAGADYVRLTAQGVREATNLGLISKALKDKGLTTPLVADIHFNPRAAEAAAVQVEKVRINPGNFADPARTFKKLEFTDDEYAAELQRVEQRLIPFIDLCKRHSTAIRVGVNHGSLSDRVMSRYGDTPAGMVESAMEFLRIFVKHDFLDVVISIKASNTVVMVETVRRLVKAMDSEGMSFPLHLGVTEAGNGEDGRVKSAVGIGALLAQGIGDTVRVSLSEEPEAEIPVAKTLVGHFTDLAHAPAVEGRYHPGYDPVVISRRQSRRLGAVGANSLPVVIGLDNIDAPLIALSADDPDLLQAAKAAPDSVILLSSAHPNRVAAIQAAIHALTAAGVDNPVIASLNYDRLDKETVTIFAAADFGTMLLNGLLDGVDLQADSIPDHDRHNLALAILQAARMRFTHTEYISCPGCGRTMFDLQSTVNQIKRATSHLPALKIGVMGCVVNGPGEMADADYGYVGAAVGRVSLYKGKTCVEKNIPSSQALPRLIQLLKSEGKWIEP